MRKIFLLGLGCALATSAIAQTEKGAHYIGANVGNLSYVRKGNGSNSISASVFPKVGVFVANNLLVGLDLQFGYERQRQASPVNISTIRRTTYGASPFARYYFAGSAQHKVFGQLSAGRYWSTFKYTSDRNTYNPPASTGAQNIASVALGYNYFLTPGAALEVMASYSRSGNPSFSNGALGVQAGFGIFLP